MGASERQKVLVEWNQTRQDYPRQACLHELFEAQAAQSPQAVAVESQGERLTYEQLNTRANQLARHLQDLGVRPEVLVGISLDSSLTLLVALLAVLKAGGAYVPLDPAYPHERLDFMIRDSGMQIVLTEGKFNGRAVFQNVRVVRADAVFSASGLAQENLSSGVEAENLAYVIYTSGSTGRPKGVMVPHRGLVNYLVWAAAAYQVVRGDGALVHSSISFDLTITGLFAPLLVGRCVHLLPQDQNLDRLANTLRHAGDFSLVKITPAHLEMLGAQFAKDGAIAATRAFIIGGEALFGESLDTWRQCAPGALLVNEYGPTETVVGCCVYFVPKDRGFTGAIPIGRPIANTQLYVLDAKREPVPIGATGELYIAGDGVARGYWNQPELTAELFVTNPFLAEVEHTSATMYRTGDLVRYLPDGNLEFLGRVDEQIKIRGYRIEPAEIEAALLTHASVRGAVVMARADPAGDKQLAAYLVPATAPPPTASELRAHLKTKVPDYLIPTVFLFVPEFPLTPNGKVNRRALPEVATELGAGSEYVAPETEIERQLASIWKDLLQQPVGLHDNFFERGGHSLLAVRLVAQINQTLGSDLDALTLYQKPTIYELAGVLRREVARDRVAKFFAIGSPTGGRRVIFLNPPLEFVRVANLMRGQAAFYISEVPFADTVVAAARRYETSAYPSLAELVAPHVTLILGSGLRGPVNLAGYSSYGTIAFEVAHRLQAAGMEVEDVFLFDADMQPSRFNLLKVLVQRHVHHTKTKGFSYLWDRVRGRWQRRQQRHQEQVTAREAPVPDACVSNGEIPWPIFQRIWDHALRGYQPQRLGCHGVLFRATTTIYGDIHDHDGCLGWKDRFALGLEIIETPGDHVTMWTEPEVQVLSRAWHHSLQKLSQSARTLLCSAPTVLAAITCSI